MTPADLRAWAKRMQYTYESAAAALGVSVSCYSKWVGGCSPIDKRTVLACAAIEAGLHK